MATGKRTGGHSAAQTAQIIEMEEVFAFHGAICDLVDAWEASLSPFFQKPDAQRHFDSLRLMAVTPEDMRRLMADMEQAVAALYKEAITAACRKRRWGKVVDCGKQPEGLDMGESFCALPYFPRLTPYNFTLPQFQVFDLLWIYKRIDWKRETLIHVYG